MVNEAVTFGIDPAAGQAERALAFSYAPADRRGALMALFALDVTLAKLALGTRDAMVAQMRLAWWREALEALDTAPPPQPILRALHTAGVDGRALAATADGWEQLLGAVDEEVLEGFAQGRAAVFRAGGAVLGAADDAIAVAGQGWALADLAQMSAAPATRALAAAMARPLLDRAAAARWSARGRPLGALMHSARMDLAGKRAPGAPGRVARLAWHRMTGR